METTTLFLSEFNKRAYEINNENMRDWDVSQVYFCLKDWNLSEYSHYCFLERDGGYGAVGNRMNGMWACIKLCIWHNQPSCQSSCFINRDHNWKPKFLSYRLHQIFRIKNASYVYVTMNFAYLQVHMFAVLGQQNHSWPRCILDNSFHTVFVV